MAAEEKREQFMLTGDAPEEGDPAAPGGDVGERLGTGKGGPPDGGWCGQTLPHQAGLSCVWAPAWLPSPACQCHSRVPFLCALQRLREVVQERGVQEGGAPSEAGEQGGTRQSSIEPPAQARPLRTLGLSPSPEDPWGLSV